MWVCVVAASGGGGLVRAAGDDLVNPVHVRRDASVDARPVGEGAPFSPAHDAVQNPAISLLADQRPARIALHTK